MSERAQWLAWVPVVFGTGAAIYFGLPAEPSLVWTLLLWLVLATGWFFCRKYLAYAILLGSATFLASGFLVAELRAIALQAPVLEETGGAVAVQGRVEEVEIVDSGKRFILKDLEMESVPLEAMPKRIRISVRTQDNNTQPGDKVSLRAVLTPPPLPVAPGAYDFARNAYFRQIGATGYAVTPLTIVEKSSSWQGEERIERLRDQLNHRILEAIGERQGSIAAALLIGKQDGIEREIVQDFRNSGLAHIFSISGLHMALVSALFFFTIRALLALSSTLALRYNIKKIAAFIALLSSFAYLLIAGSPIPAQRSFVMVAFILVAVMLDRNTQPMRCIALAALFILLTTPESIFNPSFQMSFAATLALIGFYEASRGYSERFSGYYGVYIKPLLFLGGTVASSLVAGLASAPFAIYHFNANANYGVLANMVAIPICNFWVMPWGMLAFFLFPFGLEELALVPMGWGIEGILQTAHTVASLPYNVIYVPTISIFDLSLISLGGLWLIIWQGRWRLAGLGIIALGILLCCFNAKPDIIIGQEGNLFAVRGQDGNLYLSSNRMGRYSRMIWTQRDGQENERTFRTVISPQDDYLRCDSEGCIYQKPGSAQVAIARSPLALVEDCEAAAIVVNLTHLTPPCSPTQALITLEDLKTQGTHAIWLDRDPPYIQTVAGERGKRLWTEEGETQSSDSAAILGQEKGEF